MNTNLLKAISLYEFYTQLFLLIIGISTRNTFILLLFAILNSRHIFVQLVKRYLSGFFKDMSKRPDDAFDCNVINSGGKSHTSGLISGHVFYISTITFYFLYLFTNNLKEMPNSKQIVFIILVLLFACMVMFSRVELHCHTKYQVYIAFVLGIMWGYLVYFTIEKIIDTSDRLKEDKKKIIDLFM